MVDKGGCDGGTKSRLFVPKKFFAEKNHPVFRSLIGFVGTPRSNVAFDFCPTQAESEEPIRGFFCRDALTSELMLAATVQGS